MSKIAHELESIFSKIKANEFEITPNIISLCLKAVDEMKILAANQINNKSSGVEHEEIIAQLESCLQSKNTTKSTNYKMETKKPAGSTATTATTTTTTQTAKDKRLSTS